MSKRARGLGRGWCSVPVRALHCPQTDRCANVEDEPVSCRSWTSATARSADDLCCLTGIVGTEHEAVLARRLGATDELFDRQVPHTLPEPDHLLLHPLLFGPSTSGRSQRLVHAPVRVVEGRLLGVT